MTSPIRPSVGSQSDQKTVASPFSGSYKKKKLERKSRKKNYNKTTNKAQTKCQWKSPVQDQSHFRLRLSLLQHQHNYVFNSTNFKTKKSSLLQCLANSQVIKQLKLKLKLKQT